MLHQLPGIASDQDQQTRINRIIAWRSRLTEKYRSQLGEDLVWDEHSQFESSEQPYSETVLMLAYVAAVLDQQGSKAADALRGPLSPIMHEMTTVLREAQRRGFAGSFPQWLLGAHYWLPFRRNMIIEEPNWRGTVERYGSIFHLEDEMIRLRLFIVTTDPSAAAWPSHLKPPEGNVLAAAGQANAIALRLVASAIAQRLPLSTG